MYFIAKRHDIHWCKTLIVSSTKYCIMYCKVLDILLRNVYYILWCEIIKCCHTKPIHLWCSPMLFFSTKSTIYLLSAIFMLCFINNLMLCFINNQLLYIYLSCPRTGAVWRPPLWSPYVVCVHIYIYVVCELRYGETTTSAAQPYSINSGLHHCDLHYIVNGY